ncbi:MAG TPA: LAGLIDADG family homing endonuclease [bacterium]|nr:LAGLIDADG family homing endonuclease [bacterium]
MPHNWNKGFTKENHPSVRKISDTMKQKHQDNFALWRVSMKKKGFIKSHYQVLIKNGDLAELIGVTLGDGHICIYPRTEELRIISNSNNPGFISRYALLIDKVFSKKAYIIKNSKSNSTKIGIYEKYISQRLGVPAGARKYLKIEVPRWIIQNRLFIVRYLRGLYEAEGCFAVHPGTYTYKMMFSNRNTSLLDNVYYLLIKLGFHPHRSTNLIQISKKDEVFRLKTLLKFREY